MFCSRRRFLEISVRPGRKPDFGSLSSGSIKPPIGYWLGPLAFTQEERVRFPLGGHLWEDEDGDPGPNPGPSAAGVGSSMGERHPRAVIVER